jgi:hypothetical protein
LLARAHVSAGRTSRRRESRGARGRRLPAEGTRSTASAREASRYPRTSEEPQTPRRPDLIRTSTRGFGATSSDSSHRGRLTRSTPDRVSSELKLRDVLHTVGADRPVGSPLIARVAGARLAHAPASASRRRRSS